MLNVLSILNFIKVKMLFLKSLALSFATPYVGAAFAATLFYILSAVSVLFLVYMTVMTVIKIGGMLASKTDIPVVGKNADIENEFDEINDEKPSKEDNSHVDNEEDDFDKVNDDKPSKKDIDLVKEEDVFDKLNDGEPPKEDNSHVDSEEDGVSVESDQEISGTNILDVIHSKISGCDKGLLQLRVGNNLLDIEIPNKLTEEQLKGKLADLLASRKPGVSIKVFLQGDTNDVSKMISENYILRSSEVILSFTDPNKVRSYKFEVELEKREPINNEADPDHSGLVVSATTSVINDMSDEIHTSAEDEKVRKIECAPQNNPTDISGSRQYESLKTPEDTQESKTKLEKLLDLYVTNDKHKMKLQLVDGQPSGQLLLEAEEEEVDVENYVLATRSDITDLSQAICITRENESDEAKLRAMEKLMHLVDSFSSDKVEIDHKVGYENPQSQAVPASDINSAKTFRVIITEESDSESSDEGYDTANSNSEGYSSESSSSESSSSEEENDENQDDQLSLSKTD